MVVIFNVLGFFEEFFSHESVIGEDLVFAVDRRHDGGRLVAVVGIVVGDEVDVVASFDECIHYMRHWYEMPHFRQGDACNFDWGWRRCVHFRS